MSLAGLRLLSDAEIRDSLPARFFEMKRLVQEHSGARREANLRLLQDVERLISEQRPIADWDRSIISTFLRMACALLRQSMQAARGDALQLEPEQARRFQEGSDWLCSVAVAIGLQAEAQVRREICGFWIMSRLATGLPSGALTDYLGDVARCVAPLGLDEAEIVGQAKLNLVHAASRLKAVGQDVGDLEATAQVWCRELLADPGMSKLVAGPAKRFEIEASESSQAPQATVPDEEPRNPAPAPDPGIITDAANFGSDTSSTLVEPIRSTRAVPSASKVRFHWHLFRDEDDVIDSFVPTVERMLELVKTIDPRLRREAERSLNYAKGRHRDWMADPNRGSSNVFLAPAVQAAAEVVSSLRMGGPSDAFYAGNQFGEMCKILLERNREKYASNYMKLLLEACFSVSDAWNSEPGYQTAADEGEIAKLAARIDEACLQRSLSTYFNDKARQFMRTRRPDAALAERVANEVLARHFDRELQHLLQADRPRLKEYIRLNMPTVFRLKLPEALAPKRAEWQRLLVDAGFEDVIRRLRDMGDLVSADEVGSLSDRVREEVLRAAGSNDLERVTKLLSDSAKELKSFLYSEAQRKLNYREPGWPEVPQNQRWKLGKARELARTDDPEKLKQALDLVMGVWKDETANLKLRGWVAYIQAKIGNRPAAEKLLEHIRSRSERPDFTTQWNLAVLAYDRKDEAAAYGFLTPLADEGSTDEDLIMIVLALSLRRGDHERFLNIVARMRSLKFHPLAISVAHSIGDKGRTEELLGQLIRHSQAGWELPDPGQRFNKTEDFEKVVNQAIVEGQIDQLVAWLEARIRLVRAWVPNYLQLARVLEEERRDVEGAFKVLCDRYEMVYRRRPREQRSVDYACRDLLEFCRRTRNRELGQQAYAMATRAMASQDLLDSFRAFAPKEAASVEEKPLGPERQRPIPPVESDRRGDSSSRDPQLAERLAWVTAALTRITNVSTYVSELKAIDEFAKIVTEMSPDESPTPVDLIRNISSVIETFATSEPEDHDTRRVLFDRTSNYEKRLEQLLQSGAVSRHLSDVLTPYLQALRWVAGDVSRLAGVGPDVEASIENRFISLEADRSTLVLRVSNKTVRAVTDVHLELLTETPAIAVSGKRERRINRIEPQRSQLVCIPIERMSTVEKTPREVKLNISLRASAEGFSDVDLGFSKRSVPVRSLREAVGSEQIPKLFQHGKPLDPSEPALFQGRSDLLARIQGSFHGGVQRERYFLDGIRRVGKTSLLNFLPLHLPETVVPVLVDCEYDLQLRGPIDSPQVLHGLCSLVARSIQSSSGKALDVPDLEMFRDAATNAFHGFMSSLENVTHGQIPLLMIDEFQLLLSATARSGSSRERDTLVLDLLRGLMEKGKLSALFTGSVRFDRLSDILDHRIFGSLLRLRVSFLGEEGVSNVLRGGMGEWAEVTPEAIKRVCELTGGYPWLVQLYGSAIVDLLNAERRTIVTPEDADRVTVESILNSSELFRYWWPSDQLGPEEERFIETLFRKYPADHRVSVREFFSDIHGREQPAFRRAYDNLQACEVLDSTQNEELRFGGSVLRRWLELQMQDGQLRIRSPASDTTLDRGQAGIFVDHENLLKSLERISTKRGARIPSDRTEWFTAILERLTKEAEKRVGRLSHKVAVAFWTRQRETSLMSAYFKLGYRPEQPQEIKMENAVDFKLADEVRRAREQAMKEGSTLTRAIVISGDGDYGHSAQALVNDGVQFQVWGGSRSTNEKLIGIVGDDNFVVVDDICGI